MLKWPYLILFAVLVAGVAFSSIHTIPRITPAEAGPPMMQVIAAGSSGGDAESSGYSYIVGQTSSSPSTSAKTYVCLAGAGKQSWSTSTTAFSPFPANGTLSDFKISVATAPGASTSWDFVIEKSTGVTDLAVSIAGSATVSSLDTSTVPVSIGDLIGLSATPTDTPADPSAVYWYCKFTPSTEGQTVWLGGSGSTLLTDSRHIPVMSTGTIDEDEYDGQMVIPVAGSITGLYANLPVAPSAGNSRTFVIRKNGGSESATVTISDTDTYGADTSHPVTVAAGDLITVLHTTTGSPSASSGQLGVLFTPSSSGYWCLLGGSRDSLNSGTTEYMPVVVRDTTLGTTESEQQNMLPASTFKAMYASLSADPGTDPDAYSFTLRKNSATNTGLTVTITANDTSGNYSADISGADEDLWNIEIVPLNGPSATPKARVGLAMYN
jgi:hypothetical protein